MFEGHKYFSGINIGGKVLRDTFYEEVLYVENINCGDVQARPGGSCL